MTSTLTQRYIAATMKSLGGGAHEDVQAELAASIADAVEAELESGCGPLEAERRVLTGLGDPEVLAAGYADRPLHLIGPRYYLMWRRLLKLLLLIVPSTAVGGVIIGQLLAGASLGQTAGQAAVAGITTIVHVAFWLTVVFAVFDRTGADLGVTWSVDRLPEVQSASLDRGSLMGSMVLALMVILAMAWDGLFGLVRMDNTRLPLFGPDFWPWMGGGVVVLMLGEVAVSLHILRGGQWKVPHAVAKTVLALALATILLVPLSQDALFNDDFLTRIFTNNAVTAQTIHILGILSALGIAGVALWDVIDAWLHTRRGRGGVADVK